MTTPSPASFADDYARNAKAIRRDLAIYAGFRDGLTERGDSGRIWRSDVPQALRKRLETHLETLEYLDRIANGPTKAEIAAGVEDDGKRAQILHYKPWESEPRLDTRNLSLEQVPEGIDLSEVHGDLNADTVALVERPLGMTATAHPAPPGVGGEESGWKFTRRETEAFLARMPSGTAMVTSLRHPPRDFPEAMQTEFAKLNGKQHAQEHADICERLNALGADPTKIGYGYSAGATSIFASIVESQGGDIPQHDYDLVLFSESGGLGARPELDEAGTPVRDEAGNVVWQSAGRLPVLVTDISQAGAAAKNTVFFSTRQPGSPVSSSDALGLSPNEMPGVFAATPLTQDDLELEERLIDEFVAEKTGVDRFVSRLAHRFYVNHAATHLDGTSANELMGKVVSAAVNVARSDGTWDEVDGRRIAVGMVVDAYNARFPDPAAPPRALRTLASASGKLSAPLARTLQWVKRDGENPPYTRRREAEAAKRTKGGRRPEATSGPRRR